jgi:hypothetical protein
MAGAASFADPAGPTSPLDFLGRKGEVRVGPTGLLQWDGSNWVQTPMAFDGAGLVTLPSGLIVSTTLHVLGAATIDGAAEIVGDLDVDGLTRAHGGVDAGVNAVNGGNGVFTGDVSAATMSLSGDAGVNGKVLSHQPYWDQSGGNGQSLTSGSVTTYAPFSTSSRGVTVGNTHLGVIVIVTPGIYVVRFSARINSGGVDAEHTVSVTRTDSGATVQERIENTHRPIGYAMPMSASGPMRCSAGDIITAAFYQAGGATLNSNDSNNDLRFTGVLVSDF